MLARKSFKFLAVAIAIALPAVAFAQSKRFNVHSGGGSRIIFESDAPLETITGVTSSVRGHITADPSNLSSVSGRIEVPVASLRTGIDLRDEHLRGSNWLDAERFPNVAFEITGVSGARSLRPGAEARVQVQGRFTLHGVTHDLRAPATVEYRRDGVLMVRTRFKINLPRYGVSVPTLVRLKVSDEIDVRVTLRLHEANGS